MRLVQREPFSSALDAVVEKLVVDPACPQRCQQRPLHVFRKLAGVNSHLDNRSHKPFLVGAGGEHKISPGLSMKRPSPLPLSPSDGERVAEGRVRGGSWSQCVRKSE